MTSKLPQTANAQKIERFPDFPPRDDMQNVIYLHRPSHVAALTAHFGSPGSTLVLGEIPVNWRPSQQLDQRIPDLLIAFNIDPDTAIAQGGYAILDQGKPPDFVLEVASPTTGRNDYTAKRREYAAFGITEYWRFDSSGGRYHDVPLAGDILVGNAYRPVEIIRGDETHLWGRSAVLELSLCWEEGQLRWWDPAARRYLPTYQENLDALTAAEERAESERERAETEQERAEAERQRADTAETRARELEAELERYRQT